MKQVRSDTIIRSRLCVVKKPVRGQEGRERFSFRAGFTLIELMIVVAIVAILAAVALPAYMKYVVKTKRVAAEACLSELSNYMERYYTTNLRYDQDAAAHAAVLPTLDCRTQTSSDYQYKFSANEPTKSTFAIQAVPINGQLSRDTQCGTLSIDQRGTRGATDPTTCW